MIYETNLAEESAGGPTTVKNLVEITDRVTSPQRSLHGGLPWMWNIPLASVSPRCKPGACAQAANGTAQAVERDRSMRQPSTLTGADFFTYGRALKLQNRVRKRRLLAGKLTWICIWHLHTEPVVLSTQPKKIHPGPWSCLLIGPIIL